MPTPEEMDLARQLVDALVRADPFQPRFPPGTIPLSAVVAVARTALEDGGWFPAGVRPEDLGDGALIEKGGRYRYRVHERFEVGQLNYSEVRSRSYLFLRRAVARYLRHYGPRGLYGLRVGWGS